MMRRLLSRLLPERAARVLLDYPARTRWVLYFSLGLNLLYAVFKLGMGAYYRSFWMGALGIYYAVLALMRFSLLRFWGRDTPQAGRDAYRRTAWRLNLLTLTMTGIFVQLVKQDETFRYPGVLIYAMAVFAFAKIIIAVLNLIKRRREENRVLAAARCVSFAGALMSILALQTAMISQFDGGVDFAHIMNGIAGAVITGLMITLSALMIAKSAKEASH